MGSCRIQNFLIRKNWDFFGFFFGKRGPLGGGVSPIPKGFYHKMLIFSNTQFFSRNFPSKRGGLRIQNFLIRQNLGNQIDSVKGGWVSLFWRISGKKRQYFLCLPLPSWSSAHLSRPSEKKFTGLFGNCPRIVCHHWCWASVLGSALWPNALNKVCLPLRWQRVLWNNCQRYRFSVGHWQPVGFVSPKCEPASAVNL